MNKKLKIIFTILLMVVMCMMTTSIAMARASKYIDAYNGGIHSYSNGDLEIYFNITSEGTVDKLGAKTIILQEWNKNTKKWVGIQTYSYADYPNMLKSNTQNNNFYITYSDSVSEHLYRAKIYFYAEKGGYDTRELITDSVTAP